MAYNRRAFQSSKIMATFLSDGCDSTLIIFSFSDMCLAYALLLNVYYSYIIIAIEIVNVKSFLAIEIYHGLYQTIVIEVLEKHRTYDIFFRSMKTTYYKKKIRWVNGIIYFPWSLAWLCHILDLEALVRWYFSAQEIQESGGTWPKEKFNSILAKFEKNHERLRLVTWLAWHGSKSALPIFQFQEQNFSANGEGRWRSPLSFGWQKWI